MPEARPAGMRLVGWGEVMRWRIVAAASLVLCGLAVPPAAGIAAAGKPVPADPVQKCLVAKPPKTCVSTMLYDLPLDNDWERGHRLLSLRNGPASGEPAVVPRAGCRVPSSDYQQRAPR